MTDLKVVQMRQVGMLVARLTEEQTAGLMVGVEELVMALSREGVMVASSVFQLLRLE